MKKYSLQTYLVGFCYLLFFLVFFIQAFFDKTRYIGFAGMAIFAFVPLSRWNFIKVYNNLRVFPTMFKALKNKEKSSYDRMEDFLSIGVEKKFSLMAPFIMLVLDVGLTVVFVFINKLCVSNSTFLNTPLSETTRIFWCLMVLMSIYLFQLVSMGKFKKNLLPFIIFVSSAISLIWTYDNGQVLAISSISYMSAILIKLFYYLKQCDIVSFKEKNKNYLEATVLNEVTVKNEQISDNNLNN